MIDSEAIYSALKKLKPTRTVFRFAQYTQEEMLTMLIQACRVEVEYRGRTFNACQEWLKHASDIAEWLTDPGEKTFGLFLCGGTGNGKTTFLYAIQNLTNLIRSGHATNAGVEYPGVMVCHAKDVVTLAKAANNPTKENASDVAMYHKLRKVEVLALDDVGTEPSESRNYGDYVTAVTDVMLSRYEQMRTTIISSNLSPKDISSYYDARISDRFREMMKIINFKNEKSFR